MQHLRAEIQTYYAGTAGGRVFEPAPRAAGDVEDAPAIDVRQPEREVSRLERHDRARIGVPRLRPETVGIEGWQNRVRGHRLS
jgi:hypothetical protein